MTTVLRPTGAGASPAARASKAAEGRPQAASAAARPQAAGATGMEATPTRSGPSLLGLRKVQHTRLAGAAVKPWTYAELIGQPLNAALIESQVAEIRKVMTDKGLAPAQTGMTFLVDLTGHQVSVCLACGVEGHDFRPTLVRRLNPEINMLDEFAAVVHAIASKVGMRFSIVAYDEEVLPLRKFGPPSNDGEDVLKRLQMFRERHPDLKKSIVDGVVQAWMADALKTWSPADATQKVVGQANDALAISTSERLMSEQAGGLKGVMLAKAKAHVSVRPFEVVLQAKGIKASAVAVGKQARETAAQMFRKTVVVSEMHGLRATVAPAVVSMLE